MLCRSPLLPTSARTGFWDQRMDSPFPIEPAGPAVRWESVPCPLCGEWEEEEKLMIRGDGGEYRLAGCRDCGLVYLNPRPDRSSIGVFYPPSYEPYQASKRNRNSPWDRILERLRALIRSRDHGYPPDLTRSQRLLALLVSPWFRRDPDSLTSIPYEGGGRLLDVGCGSGWYAARMRERGWQVTAMDFNAETARQAQARYGFPVLAGTLPHPDLAPESFDVITMGAVLEHVHDPHQIVAGAVEGLRRGGRLVISVPNYASWASRFFGPDWWGLELPRHLLHFTPATLSRLLEDHGLFIRDLSTPVHVGWWRRSLARCTAAPRRRRLLHRVLSRVRPLTSLMARAAGRRGEGDSIRVIAERPAGTLVPRRRVA